MSKLPFYRKHYAALFEPLLDLMTHGVRVNVARMKAKHAELRSTCKELAAQLDHLTGSDKCECGHSSELHPRHKVNVWAGVLRKDGKPRVAKWKVVRRCYFEHAGYSACPSQCQEFAPKFKPLVTSKDISNARFASYLYDHLGLPEQKAPRGEGERTRTANELACRRLRRIVLDYLELPDFARKRAKLRWKKVPKRTLKILDAALLHKRASKLSTFVNVKKVDPDGRMRCSYKFTTITGRLSSSKNPLGGGYNLQNPDREIRDCFIPDHDDWFFVEADYSMGETRLLYALTGEPELVRLAQALPSEVDTYKENAARIFNVKLKDVTKEQRYNAKRATLASGYGMSAWRMSEILAVEGEDKSVEECEALLSAYFNSRPAVLEYQRWVRTQIIRERILRTCWGRELNVKWARLSKEVYKQGYAFLPQSTLGDALNQLGLVPIHKWLNNQLASEPDDVWGKVLSHLQSKINLQVHDALVLSCPPEEVHPVMTQLVKEMTKPLVLDTIKGTKVELSIPVELKLGRDWSFKGGFEWKKLPSEREVRSAISSLRSQPRVAA